MFSKTVERAAIALALFSLSAAQTTTSCDPLLKSCPNDPAFGGDASFDFSTVSTIKDLESFWNVDDGVRYKNQTLGLDKNGGNFIIFTEGDAPTITSNKYLFFGKVEVSIQSAPGQGIITSLVLQSDDRDEIDWEIIGSRPTAPETNFYGKGVNDFTHSGKIEVDYTASSEVHTYAIDWTPEYITYSIDGKVVRTATPAELKDANAWPQTPAQVRLGTWVGGGKDSPEGTTEWAGGKVQWNQAPFAAIYKSVKITDYGGGHKGATEYVYGDKSGSWKSIKVQGGTEAGIPGLPASLSTSNPPPTAASTLPAPTTDSAVQSKASTTSASSTKATQTTSSTSHGSSSTTAGNSTTAAPTKTQSTSSPPPTTTATTTTKPNAGVAGATLNAGMLALLVAPLFL